eukprot:TRINITY_DN6548_c3_g1_i1.p1 TRINITY_DN6548_c3_g1~~TRINITY_DN6548_c3_g1_i1.p1  ORF type:complete len:131 (+),score=18.91 TRINITY_DN6548_c3_g1_i1:133-525(+)
MIPSSGSEAADQFSLISDLSCETFSNLVNELKAARPGLASSLDVGGSHTYEVAMLTTEVASQRLRFAELAWEGVLQGKESENNNISELMSWLAPLRARFSHNIPDPNTPSPTLPWREPTGSNGWINRYDR